MNDRKQMTGATTANDSSSETAEGGGGLARRVPTGGPHRELPESECAPDEEARAVTARSRPERFSAAPLLGVFSLRRGCGKESEKSVELALDEWSESALTLGFRERMAKDSRIIRSAVETLSLSASSFRAQRTGSSVGERKQTA